MLASVKLVGWAATDCVHYLLCERSPVAASSGLDGCLKLFVRYKCYQYVCAMPHNLSRCFLVWPALLHCCINSYVW